MQGAVLRFLGISAMKYNTISLFSVRLIQIHGNMNKKTRFKMIFAKRARLSKQV